MLNVSSIKTSHFALTIFLLFALTPLSAATDIKNSDIELELHLAPEDREVGLKRLELIDKMLSKDLIDRKRVLVKELEADYNEKTLQLLQSLISPIIKQTVITHIDVNFFSTNFDSELHSSQKVSMSIIIKKSGFEVWGDQFSSKKEALDAIKKMVSTTLNIQADKISIMLV